ncbi:F-box protein CPR1 [Camellia lanceoleosa]|uniref:F-box protein CPR1 n=1 Tax=Camellia lanceoleosa TaxID=1840588 RepID=A0ACC0GN08_9ERIC|nr:F-box protein CPR1 [Camellia lanceoleosa]
MLDICFSCILMNPSTKQSRKLPKSSFSKPKFHLNSYGLGHDSSNNDYKVVRISHHDQDANCADNMVSVYTLRMNLWRRIEDSPYDHKLHRPSRGILVRGALHWIFVNGARHWFASSFVGSNNLTVIASLDLTYENFGDVPSPVDEFVLFEELSVLRGCLCILVSRCDGCKEVWVMKEYGVKDSWTKFTINHGCFPLCKALCLSKTGEFLLGICQKKLIFYNPQEKKIKRLVVQACPNNFVAGTYVESLVSPNCSNMIMRQ